MYSIKRNFAFYGIAFLILLMSIILVILLANLDNTIESIRESIFLIPSFILFLVTFLLSIISIRFYFIFFIFQLISLPSVFNYIFPSILLGVKSDVFNAPFPFITNIDIYLIFGIILGLINKRTSAFSSWKISFILISLLVSFLLNLITTDNSILAYLLFTGTYHIRFILLLYLLFNLWDFRKYEMELLIGFVISVAFLFFEALIYSSQNGMDRLTSGTLGSNTFGNIIAGIGVSLYFIFRTQKQKTYKRLSIFGFILCCAIVILTLNRSSIFAMLIATPVIYFYQRAKPLKNIFYISISIIVIFLAINILPIKNYFNFLPKRLNVFSYFNEINFKEEVRTSETSSLITRFLLFKTSLKMIEKNPIIGIGNGRWNYLKSKYGFNEGVLIDSHNGFLSMISQYGILALPILYYIYLFPFKVWRRVREKVYLIDYFIIINMVMLFCDLTNAGISKYQVASLMIFIMFLAIDREKEFLTGNNFA